MRLCLKKVIIIKIQKRATVKVRIEHAKQDIETLCLTILSNMLIGTL